MGTSKQKTHEEEPPSEVRPRRPHILVAEADATTRRMVAAALRSDGYDVTEAENGFELLDQLRAPLLLSEPAEGPDAIIMGVWMPGVSGLPILEGLRDVGLRTPIVLLSGGFGHILRATSEELGANAVFEKPFDIDDLRTVVLNMVSPAPGHSLRHSSAPPQRDSSASAC
jgi:DNA-binding response OmpR family regulator